MRERKRIKFVPYQPEEEQFYDHFFSIYFEGDKRKINPFAIIDSIAECTGMKPKRILGMNKTSVIVEVHNGEQSAKTLALENVCHTPCKATPYERFNYTTGLVYINEFDIEDLEEFK